MTDRRAARTSAGRVGGGVAADGAARTGGVAAGGATVDATGAGSGGRTRGYLWEALVRPGGKLKPGRTVEVAPDLVVHIVDSTPDPRPHRSRRDPRCRSKRRSNATAMCRSPPPTCARQDEPVDRARYQTVYARTPGSVAAPTAGLHFTRSLMGALQAGRCPHRAASPCTWGWRPSARRALPEATRAPPGEERYHVPREPAARVASARAAGGAGCGPWAPPWCGRWRALPTGREGCGRGAARPICSSPPALRLPVGRRAHHQLPPSRNRPF